LVTVRDIMHKTTVVEGRRNIQDVAKLMSEKNIGSVFISQDGQITGILTERDILRKVVADGMEPLQVTAKEIATHKMITIDANADVTEASRMFGENNIRRLPVTDGGKIIGIVTVRGVAKSLRYHYSRKINPEHDEYRR